MTRPRQAVRLRDPAGPICRLRAVSCRCASPAHRGFPPSGSM